MAEQRADAGERFVVDRGIELRRRDVSAQRAAHLHRADRPARRAATAVIVQQLAQAEAKGALDESTAADVARELYGQRAARFAHAEVRVSIGAVLQDPRHARERHDVIDDGGLAEQALDRRQGRAHAHLAAPALEALEHRGLFAADVGPGAHTHLEIKTLTRAGNVAAEVARLVGRGDGGAQRAQRMRVFGTQIDVTLGRPHRDAGDGHALDQGERIAFHQHAIGEGAGVAFVGVAGNVFLLPRRLIEHRLPLDAGRESRPAPPAQARGRDGLHDRGRLHGQRPCESLVAAVRHIIRNARGLDDAYALEGQTLLTLEPGDFARRSERQRMGAAVEKVRVEEAGDVGGRHGAVRQAAERRQHLDERLEPIGAARAVAHHLDGGSAARGLRSNRERHFTGPQGQGAGVNGYIHQRCHGEGARSATRASKRSGVTRPYSRPSIMTAGEQAQLPRQ